MARPTNEVKSHIVKARIGDDLYDKLNGENVSEIIREALECYVAQKDSSVTHNDDSVSHNSDDSVTQNLQRENEELKAILSELSARVTPEASENFKNEMYSGLKIVPVDYATQNSFDLPPETEVELKDTLHMVKLSVEKESDVAAFLKDFHDKMESGEYQIVNGKLKLGYHEVFEVLGKSEVKRCLKAVWAACEEKGISYADGIEAVFKKGSPLAVNDIYGDRQ